MKNSSIIYATATIFWFVFYLTGIAFSTDAETVLKNYLQDRSEGKYQTCSTYYSTDFKTRHIKYMGTDCYNFFRSREVVFKNPKIIKKQDDENIIFLVDVDTEDPTSIQIWGKAKERYEMILENGEWKISDWTIEYK